MIALEPHQPDEFNQVLGSRARAQLRPVGRQALSIEDLGAYGLVALRILGSPSGSPRAAAGGILQQWAT
jgi:hypothetical protein